MCKTLRKFGKGTGSGNFYPGDSRPGWSSTVIIRTCEPGKPADNLPANAPKADNTDRLIPECLSGR